MKINIFKFTFLFALVAAVLTSCDDDGYWEPFNAEGDQYSFITTSVSRNYKRATSSEGKNPYYVYTLRRATNVGEATVDVNVTGTETALGYFSWVPAEGEVGTPLTTEGFVPTATFADGSYEATFILEYTYGYRRIVTTTKLTLAFNADLKSPGGKNSAEATVAVSTSGKD